MNKKWIRLSIVLMLVSAIIISGCSSGTKDETNETPAATTAATGTKETPAPVDPMGKYETPITITSAKSMDSGVKFIEGQDINNNIWTKEYEDKLGIKLKYDWTVSSEGVAEGTPYAQKMNVVITSKDIPDTFVVNAQQFQMLAEADQLADLTEIWDQYASADLKAGMERDKVAFQAATVKGKLLGLPGNSSGGAMNSQMVWIRTDWMEKLKLSPPKTIDELYAIAEAFTNGDPDGDNKKNTTGMALTKDLYGYVASADGFFQGYKAYPQLWLKDAQDSLIYGSIQPEAKAALAKMQEMYKNGLIDKEFGVKDAGKVVEAVAQNSVGIQYGVNWNTYYPLADGITKNPEMDWKAYPMPTLDGSMALPGVGGVPYVDTFLVVKKGYEHPEAIVKMMNLAAKEWSPEYTAEEAKRFTLGEGIMVYKYQLMQYIPMDRDMDVYKALVKAEETGDTSKLMANEKGAYDANVKFAAGDRTLWSVARQVGLTDSSYAVVGAMYKEQTLSNAFYGAPTPTMVDKWSSLIKLEIETFTKIIMGAAPIDDFDKFVANWKSLGGDQITKEVNEWKAKVQ